MKERLSGDDNDYDVEMQGIFHESNKKIYNNWIQEDNGGGKEIVSIAGYWGDRIGEQAEAGVVPSSS